MIKLMTGGAMVLALLAGCSPKSDSAAPSAASAQTKAPAAKAAAHSVDKAKLAAVLADPRRDKDRPRDVFRHTAETMTFFGIAPNDNVVEVLPGGGWYTRVLLPYVTPDGGWYGLNYSPDLRRGILAYAKRDIDEEAMAKYSEWPQNYPARAAKNGPADAVVKGAFFFGQVPDADKGKMDAVLFFRALHHLNRIDPKFMQEAIADSYALLKPGGIVGVVQHRAREDYGDKDYDTSGHKGYMKQSYVIAMFEKGGFVLDGKSEINANPKDTADYEGGVWTLPPSLRGRDESMKAHYRAIGESDRMTLRFRKPS